MAKENHTYWHKKAKQEEGNYQIAMILPRNDIDIWTGKKKRKQTQ